jgi:hypothetical protein
MRTLILLLALQVWSQTDTPEFRAKVLEQYVVIAERDGKEVHLEEIIEDYAEEHYIIPVLCYACDRLNETSGFHRRCIKAVAEAVLNYTNQRLPIVLRLDVNHDQERAEAVKQSINSDSQCTCASVKCGYCITKELQEGFELPGIFRIAVEEECEKAKYRLEAEKMP